MTLNVWAPAESRRKAKQTLLPVLVFIYGGNFQYGDTAQKLYDGFNLTQTHDVIVMSMNYRLGVLGFLALPELQASETAGSAAFNIPANTTGNFGLQDQRAALAFIRSNARNFGG